MQKNADFFDELSVDYDEMIRFNESLKRRKNLLNNFIPPGMKTAADIGCGSGLDSISLALNGLTTTAFDSSAMMLEQAKQNALKHNVNVSFVHLPLEKINASLYNNYDMIVSLGNTLANLNKQNLRKGVNKIFKMLKPKRLFLMQILNYEHLLLNKERIVNITANDEKTFIRFYDYFSRHLNFNVLSINKNNSAERKLITTKLYPHHSDFLKIVLRDIGFKRIQFYGNLTGERFSPSKSKDLVIKAVK